MSDTFTKNRIRIGLLTLIKKNKKPKKASYVMSNVEESANEIDMSAVGLPGKGQYSKWMSWNLDACDIFKASNDDDLRDKLSNYRVTHVKNNMKSVIENVLEDVDGVKKFSGLRNVIVEDFRTFIDQKLENLQTIEKV